MTSLLVWKLLVSLILLAIPACHSSTEPQPNVTLTVSAAANLTAAFQEIGRQFTQQSGIAVTFNFSSSGHLTQQIASGAPVDVFAAANTAFIDDLDRQGVIVSETKQPYAVGRLTLWMRSDSALSITRLEDVARPAIQRLAIANPTHAPYGVAARQALQTVGLWESLQPKLVLGENVRQTLQYAATGNVDVAIVARSLSQQHEGRWILLPATLHAPIKQSLAVIKASRYPVQAQQFAAFVTGSHGQDILRQYGFDRPEPESSP